MTGSEPAVAPAQTQTETPAVADAADYTKAPVGKRVLAVLIDTALVMLVWFIFRAVHLAFIGGLVTMAYSFLKDGIDFGGLDNRSVGKKVMGLRVMNLATKARCTYVDSLLRQILFIIPLVNVVIAIIEFVLVLVDPKGIRLGDKIAKTMVIESA